MTALERIKEIDGIRDDVGGMIRLADATFLLRAFRVMREIAIEHADAGEACLDDKQLAEMLDGIFEERMKQ